MEMRPSDTASPEELPLARSDSSAYAGNLPRGSPVTSHHRGRRQAPCPFILRRTFRLFIFFWLSVSRTIALISAPLRTAAVNHPVVCFSAHFDLCSPRAVVSPSRVYFSSLRFPVCFPRVLYITPSSRFLRGGSSHSRLVCLDLSDALLSSCRIACSQ
jgi:hypothetical protein